MTLDDDYMGSGTAITRAIRKHGKHNFRKEILQFFSTEQEAYQEEARVVNETYVASEHTYNLTVGGNKPPPRKNVPHTLEARKKLIEYANSEEGKQRNSKAGKKAWQVKGKWTHDEITRRVATRKTEGSYSTDMSSCHTKEAILKRETTKKQKGVKYNTSSCNSKESVHRRETTKLIKRIRHIEEHYGDNISMELIKRAKKEKVAHISISTLSRYLTAEYTHLLPYDEQQSR